MTRAEIEAMCEAFAKNNWMTFRTQPHYDVQCTCDVKPIDDRPCVCDAEEDGYELIFIGRYKMPGDGEWTLNCGMPMRFRHEPSAGELLPRWLEEVARAMRIARDGGNDALRAVK